MSDKKFTVMIARMAYEGRESSKLVDWLLVQAVYLNGHSAVEEVYHTAVKRTAPVARARNTAALAALTHGADILVMVDDDITPHPEFLPRAITLFRENEKRGIGAGVVVAPAICGDGKSNIFLWTTPNIPIPYTGAATLERMGALEASYLRGATEAAAAGTGCIAVDTRLFNLLDRPWFAVEYADEQEVEIATGEDVYFTRTVTELGFRVQVLWDCWADHEKEGVLRKPVPIRPDSIPARYREILEHARQS